jgi:hypothetical protein
MHLVWSWNTLICRGEHLVQFICVIYKWWWEVRQFNIYAAFKINIKDFIQVVLLILLQLISTLCYSKTFEWYLTVELEDICVDHDVMVLKIWSSI